MISYLRTAETGCSLATETCSLREAGTNSLQLRFDDSVRAAETNSARVAGTCSPRAAVTDSPQKQQRLIICRDLQSATRKKLSR